VGIAQSAAHHFACGRHWQFFKNRDRAGCQMWADARFDTFNQAVFQLCRVGAGAQGHEGCDHFAADRVGLADDGGHRNTRIGGQTMLDFGRSNSVAC